MSTNDCVEAWEHCLTEALWWKDNNPNSRKQAALLLIAGIKWQMVEEYRRGVADGEKKASCKCGRK